jgi:uracil-DNA glycosylase
MSFLIDSPEDDGLDELRSTIANCRICRDTPRLGTEPLPHEPRPINVFSRNAKILIASQAPGLRAHLSGLPFDDASGNRLREWLGVDRDTFYDRDQFAIVPMGFCFPGYDKNGADMPPRKECAPQWRSQVLDVIPQIELTLTIGLYAQKWHLGDERKANLTETVANWRRYFERNSGPKVLALPHPSWRNSGWLKRNSWFEADLLPILRKTVQNLLR